MENLQPTTHINDVPIYVLKGMYIMMLRIRRTEEKIVDLYPEQGMRCPTHLYIGQEAVAVGVCANLQKEDYVFGYYRGHGHYLAKGGDMKKLLAELYGKATGCAKGKGGSMHIVAPEVNFMGCSALVGGGMPMAAGAALAAMMQRSGQIAVSFIGDGVVEEGVFHETMNYASLRKLPVIFVCENNFYAVHAHQSVRQPGDNIHERAAGYFMPGVRVDGNDVIDVYQAAKEATQRARSGGGPTLIECRTYRWLEHVGPYFDWDLGYRTREEGEEWMAKCPVKRFEKLLRENGLLSDAEQYAIIAEIDKEVDDAFQFAKASPFPDITELEQDVYADSDDSSASPISSIKYREIKYSQAINEALQQAMEQDDRVFLMGLGVDDPKGIFGSTLGLWQRFGRERVFDTPIAENGMTGIAIGAALAGMRPVMSHQRMDFMLYCMDQLINHAAKWRYMSGGLLRVPLTVRAIVGRGWGQGAQHSQSLQAFFAHVPGLKVVMPSSPYDVKGLLLAGIADDNPVIFIEHRRLYDLTGPVPEEPYTIPLGKGIIRREGKDVTVVAMSYMVSEAEQAADVLTAEGIEVELVDPRTLKPLDEELIVNSVKKTGRLVVVDNGWKTAGFGAEIAARVAYAAFEPLEAPIVRVAFPDVPTPTTITLEQAFYPGIGDIVAAVKEVVFGKLQQIRISNNTFKDEFTGPF